MRLLLTVSSGERDADVVVEVATGARVRDLAAALAGLLPGRARVVPHGSGHLGVVEVVRDEQDAPDLYWRAAVLDQDLLVADSPLRHGSVVGLGGPSHAPWFEPGGVLEVRVVSGRGAGTVHRLSAGVHTVGRSGAADVPLADDVVPDVAVELEVDVQGRALLRPVAGVTGRRLPSRPRREPLDGPIVVPGAPPAVRARRGRVAPPATGLREVGPDDDLPVVRLDREELTAPVTWLPGQSLAVGDVLLELAEVVPPDASMSATPGGATLDYNRPPRIRPPERRTAFRLPSEPRVPRKVSFPLAMMLAPAVLGVVMFLWTHQAYTLAIMALSPVMAVAGWASGRRAGRRQFRDEWAEYATRRRRVEQEAHEALVAESALRRRENPDPAAVLLFATGPRARLWERRPNDPDWMVARVGTADVPSEVTLDDPARDEHARSLHWTAADVPVGVPLARVGVTGVAGSPDTRGQVAAWMVAQVVTMHSPADVDLVVLADQQTASWTWTRWLPHVRREGGGAIASVAADDEATGRRIAELTELVERRAASAREGVATRPLVLVVLDGARRLRLLPGMVALLRDGPAVGLVFVCVDADERDLPEECRAVVRLDGSDAHVSVAGRDPVEAVRPDLVPPEWFEQLGRALAPVRDVSEEDAAAGLPTAARLLDVLALDPPVPEAIAAGWQRGGRTTAAVVGIGADGPFAVDVRADGPHGLVAGTTGSGKSELLQTLIASLAIGNRPDEMTFVLVDYKGGAAFKDCARLPHTVGMVTDLDAHLTTRALASLAAELRRREHLLAGAGAKDIEDYLAQRRSGDEPMPRLLLVIDEFAALVTELPDFVHGLIDIARRGRSLGVHLLLATQRPAGVVSAEITSNTNLRIALRVTDTSDSQDVIGSTDAGLIPQGLPGRGYARVGASSLVAFQTARVGGRPPGSTGGGAVQVGPFTFAGAGRPAAPLGARPDEEQTEVPTDLALLVTAVQQATVLQQVAPPPPPWLPALPEVATVDDLPAGSRRELAPFALAYGLVDLPALQRRDVASYDVATAGNLAIVGGPRSGRSTALRALAGALARDVSADDVHLYGVDCGNNALLPLLALPHTGAVVGRDQPERLSRLAKRLLAEISRRQQLLAQRGVADVGEQRAGAAPADRLPYLLVLLDRWEGFVQAFEDHDAGALVDAWTQILQEGPAAGVKVVLTGDRSLLVGRVAALSEDRVMLRMPDPADYVSVGMTPREVPDRLGDGRAFGSGGTELQVLLLDEDPNGAAQVAALQRLGRAATPASRHRPFRVDTLPTQVTLREALALGGPALGAHAVPVGVGGDELRLLSFEAEEHGPGVLVLGPRRSGRSTTLHLMAASALDRGWSVGMALARRSPLSELAGHPGVRGVLGPDATRDEVTAVLSALVPTEAPTVLLVDDLELFGTDGPVADAIVAHLGAIRDRPALVVAAGTTEELAGAYRGPAATLKRSRSGLLLSPTGVNDGDLLGLRLPRSIVGGMGAGRGVLAQAGAWQIVQVPRATP